MPRTYLLLVCYNAKLACCPKYALSLVPTPLGLIIDRHGFCEDSLPILNGSPRQAAIQDAQQPLHTPSFSKA